MGDRQKVPGRQAGGRRRDSRRHRIRGGSIGDQDPEEVVHSSREQEGWQTRQETGGRELQEDRHREATREHMRDREADECC